MPLSVPNPTTDTEVAAVALIRTLERAVSFDHEAPEGPWLAALMKQIALGEPDRTVVRCAATIILRAQRQTSKPRQYATLAIVACMDPATVNVRTTFHMQELYNAIASLWRAAHTPTGLTARQLELIGRDLITYAMAQGDPGLRLTFDDIDVYRRVYHRLRIYLVGA